ncbi:MULTISPECIES: hypothetical protein [Moorena]|uniref:hypothetical protein n=1 Tax=Moorena TaxID=1155738 RepID=UPI0012B537B8|nr:MULTISPECIES: hypothetical protein [Moorena]NEP64515.1 hypothetical protein [Moorena sp. SIO3A5]NER87679.1 hypothetical protein [Moorena sp. SIO3A2]
MPARKYIETGKMPVPRKMPIPQRIASSRESISSATAHPTAVMDWQMRSRF